MSNIKIYKELFNLDVMGKLTDSFWQTLMDNNPLSPSEWLKLEEETYYNRGMLETRERSLLDLFLTRHPSHFIAQRLTQDLGPEIWTLPCRKESGSILEAIVVNYGSDGFSTSFHNDNYTDILSLIIQNNPGLFDSDVWKKIITKIPKVLESNKETAHSYFDRPTDSWEPKVLPVLRMIERNHYKAVGECLREDPTLLTYDNEGQTLSTILMKSGPGCDVLLRNGGSIFTPVFLDINSNKKTDTSIPLWDWAIRRKHFHSNFSEILKSLMFRLENDSEPKGSDVYIAQEDWEKLKQSKNKIQAAMLTMSFEKEINQDWRQAIKCNKMWRKWRSVEGANFMHWLAASQPASFIKSGLKIKLNNEMAKGVDQYDRNIFHYGIVGLLSDEFGGWRKKNKIFETIDKKTKETPWQTFINHFKTHIKEPEYHGLLPDLLFSSETSYFSRVKNFSRHTVQTLVKDRLVRDLGWDKPARLNYFWKGLDDPSLMEAAFQQRTISKSQSTFGTAGSILTEFAYTFEEDFSSIFQDLPVKNRFILSLMLLSPENASQFQHKVFDTISPKGYQKNNQDFLMDQLNTLFENPEIQSLPLRRIKQIQTVLEDYRRHIRYNASYTEGASQLLAKIEKLEINLSLSGIQEEKEDLLSVEPVRKKRKM